MTRHDDASPVRDMLDHAAEAVAMARGRVRADLDRHRMLELSLARLVEIVGEAAGRVSDDFRKQHLTVPWRQVSDMRNRLIHGYDTVDLDILWDVVQINLPPLIAELEKIVGRTNRHEGV